MVQATDPGASTRPTHARYTTTAFAMMLAVVMYIDRIAISQAAPAISADLGLSKIQLGWALSAFGWAYAVFEIPGGWLGDRIGPRRVLVRIVLWWSIFTAATGWAWNATSLVVTRALFGAGEAGCFPNLTRVLTIWLPHGERERAQGFLWFAARWSGAFTPILVALVLDYVTWRGAFELFGVLGIVWAIIFYRWYRDDPRAHPGVNAAEAALLPPAAHTAVGARVPWRRLGTNRSVWLLCVQYACLAYGWWFYVTWLPTYLREARGTGVKFGALLAGLPLLLGGVGCLVSGAMLPRVARAMGSVAAARRGVAIVGFVGASASILVFTRIADPVTAMLVLGLAGFFNDFVMPAAWTGCMDIGGRYAGTLSGAMNTFGSVAGALSALIVGYLLTWTGQNWTLTFYVSCAIYLVGGLCWLFIDAHTPIEE
ncbi:MAG TPA: MFS transporter [Vicinamibacterales bacterium]|nr:MFS transporter [Vicinamibacterales bacterium]